MRKEKIAFVLLILIGIISIIGLITMAPIQQDAKYHLFCNESKINGINNFWNVVSNLPFLIVGLYGLFKLYKQKVYKLNYYIFFVGVSLVSIGSGYYHLNPTNDTLIWDRLPMTIAFTAFISIMVANFINKKAGTKLLLPILGLGILSIVYWVWSGDLSLYVFIQFYPIIAIPIVLLLFRDQVYSVKGYWLLILCYLLAKTLETYDHEVHHLLGFVSGHPLKHLAAALGIFFFTIYDRTISSKVTLDTNPSS